MLPSSPLIIVEGLFFDSPTKGVLVLTTKGLLNLREEIQDFIQKEVLFSLNYSIPVPPMTDIPGFGACVYPDYCKVHKEDPTFLMSFSGEGILEMGPEGDLFIGGTSTQIKERVFGHYCRVVLFKKTPRVVDSSLEGFLEEVEGITSMLKAFQREIK